MQDVPVFVQRKGLEFQDYLDVREPAIIDADHCVRLNYEAYFFGNLWTREQFVSDPTVYCGLLTDPVSKRRFRPTETSPRTSHNNVTYYFESEPQREAFTSSPDAYVLPGWKM